MGSSICLHNGTILTGYGSLPDSAVWIEDGRIVDLFSEKRFHQKRFDSSTRIVDVGKNYIAPGFVDNHIHGFAGFGTDDRSSEAIAEMSRALAQYGVTSFCPTIYPQEVEDFVETIRACLPVIGREPGAKIVGLHLEGPFLSPEKPGVQRLETLLPVDLNLMQRFWQEAQGQIVAMTVAPELKNMRDLALYCIHKRITLQAGHTNATYENMVEGFQAGILHSTHFYNAMSSMHHRNPGAVGAILAHPEVGAEIIADGRHVHPALVQLLLRDKPIGKIVLVTDALKPTEQRSGTFFANSEEVYLEDEIFLRRKDDVIAGSSLTMIKGIRNLVSWGVRLEDAIKMATTNPVSILGKTHFGNLIPDYWADVVVFDASFRVLTTIVRGEFLKNEF